MINKSSIEKKIRLHRVALKTLEEDEFVSMWLLVKGKWMDVTKDNRLQAILLVKEALNELEDKLV